MQKHQDLDIYGRLARNRRRLALAFCVCAALAMGISAGGAYYIYNLSAIAIPFWVLTLLFWLLYLAYAITAYALSGRFVLSRLRDLRLKGADRMLEDALAAVSLAAGFTSPVHLKVIDHADVNSFSLSLPDGSYLLFVTGGVAEKLSPREREAVIAHELSHMEMGDTLIYTLMMRLKGPVAGRVGSETGFKVTGRSWRSSNIPALLVPLWFLTVYTLALSQAIGGSESSSSLLSLILLLFLLIPLALALPPIMYSLLRLFLDKEREYAADMRAVFLTRDPEAVYEALRKAAQDVRDVMLLPSALDALLFHPVVDFISYRPFQTQPTMQERMQRLREAFPVLRAGDRER